MNTTPKIKTVREMAKDHPSFSEGSLRWYIQHARRFGLEVALVRKGRRIFIDEAKFFEEFSNRKS